MNIQTSFLTPPFGFALFYLRGVAPAVVKTLDMYKGVIGFIALQLVALGIVANFPSLVNYLPNRVQLLSETSPPPRNPRIEYCVEEYVYGQFTEANGRLPAAIATMQGVDASFLPEAQQDNLTGSYEAVDAARAALIASKEAERVEMQAAVAYRPKHVFVRGLERDARVFEAQIQPLERRQSRLRGDDNIDARARVQEQIDAAIASRDALLAQIPADWPETRAEFVKLTKEADRLRAEYRSAADTAYGDVLQLKEVLAGNEAFVALAAGFDAIEQAVANRTPDEAQDVIQDFETELQRVDGTSKIKTQLSRARRELKKRTTDMDKVTENITEARALYAAQGEWRQQVTPEFTAALDTYETAMRNTVGLRQQTRLTRDQALFVAQCQSHHRDISLNF